MNGIFTPKIIAGNIFNTNKLKIHLTNQLDDAKRLCDDESKERQSLMGRYRNLEHEFDGTNLVYDLFHHYSEGKRNLLIVQNL